MGTVRHILHRASTDLLATPRKSDGERGGRGDVLSQIMNYPSAHAGFLPTPAKRDIRMDRWSTAYEKRKSPSLDALMDGAAKMLHSPTRTANQTAPSMLKWAGARALAAMLADHGLSGTSALPVTYGWMMGYPPGWLLRPALALDDPETIRARANWSPPSATPSSRKSPKASGGPSGARKPRSRR
jgi:hypothetical protein